MTPLDVYLERLAVRQLLLLYICMLKDDTRGALLLLAGIDVRICPSKHWHRKEYRYIGNGHFVCDACTRLEYGGGVAI